MLFTRLSEYLSQLEQTTLRNKMVEILTSLFKEADKEEIGKLCYLLQGRVAPLYEAIEFGMADKMMIRAVAQGLGETPDKVAKVFQKEGDLGITVEEIKNKILNIKNITTNAGSRSSGTYKKLNILESVSYA